MTLRRQQFVQCIEQQARPLLIDLSSAIYVCIPTCVRGGREATGKASPSIIGMKSVHPPSSLSEAGVGQQQHGSP